MNACPTIVLLLVAWIGAPCAAQGPSCAWSAPAAGPDGEVLALASFDDGGGQALFAGGAFNTAGGAGQRGIARLAAGAWSSVGGGISGGPGSAVRALAVFDDGSGPALYAGGSFTAMGGVPASALARWDGVTWTPLGAGILGDVHALAVFDDGSGAALYAGGRFSVAGSLPAANIARWDGFAWTPLLPGIGVATSAIVHVLATHADAAGPVLYAGGMFTSAGGSPALNLARFDGSTWSQVGQGVGPLVGDRVEALTVWNDGTGPALFVGGTFFNAGSVAANDVARWDGSAWSPLGPGLGGFLGARVTALLSYDDSPGPALHACGDFSTAGGAPAARIARWDGALWSAVSSGLSGATGALPVRGRALALHDDGSGVALQVGGAFSQAGGIAAPNLAAFGSCGAPIPGITLHQPAPGAGVLVLHGNLVPGHVYRNFYSLDACPGPPGSGPLLGLCATSPAAIGWLVTQTTLPLGTPAAHFAAQQPGPAFGPFQLPPLTVEALCIDVTGGLPGPVSSVVRLTVQ